MSITDRVVQPNNQSTTTNPVGRFMVAVGSIMIHAPTGKMLVTQRARTLDWNPNQWEITYGRIDQFEDPEQGLRREIKEELGITDFSIRRIQRSFHMYRGPQTAENELIGITYQCQTESDVIKLSVEHQAYRWVTPDEALELITVPGIRQDVEIYRSQL